MKAILVFDVENIDIENTQATYIELQCNNLTIQMALLNHWLKPIPQKRELEESGNSLIDDCKEYYTDGWNDCLDEILGETE